MEAREAAERQAAEGLAGWPPGVSRMPRQLDSVCVAQDRPSQGPRLQPSPPQPPRQRPAKARPSGQARGAMTARTARPRPRQGCRRAHRRLRRPRQPPGPPGPQALARNVPPARTMGNQARRPRARDGTRPSAGPRPDRGTHLAVPLRIHCRTALAASIGHRSGTGHRHVRQASARIVPSGSRQRQP